MMQSFAIDARPAAARRRIGAEPEGRIERRSSLPDIRSMGSFLSRRAVMPKRVDVSSSALQSSDTAQFVSIALFSGVGLLVSLVIVICRMNGIF